MLTQTQVDAQVDAQVDGVASRREMDLCHESAVVRPAQAWCGQLRPGAVTRNTSAQRRHADRRSVGSNHVLLLPEWLAPRDRSMADISACSYLQVAPSAPCTGPRVTCDLSRHSSLAAPSLCSCGGVQTSNPKPGAESAAISWAFYFCPLRPRLNEGYKGKTATEPSARRLGMVSNED